MMKALWLLLSCASLARAGEDPSLALLRARQPDILRANQAWQGPVSLGPIPAWLAAHVGDARGQISRVVLERARALYAGEASVRNACYVAVDATRPHRLGEGRVNQRLYLICEPLRLFIPLTATHGTGVSLPAYAPEHAPPLDLSNDRKCAKHFGNALNSMLTTGGAYRTGEVDRVFKGKFLHPLDPAQPAYVRPFLELAGEGDTANAAERSIGVHPAVSMSGGCYRQEPRDPYADSEGFVYYSTPHSYYDGRTNGCLGLHEAVADLLIPLFERQATTIYVYPESADIRALRAGAGGVYWNKECLAEIGRPDFSDTSLNRRIADSQPTPTPPGPRPMCK